MFTSEVPVEVSIEFCCLKMKHSALYLFFVFIWVVLDNTYAQEDPEELWTRLRQVEQHVSTLQLNHREVATALEHAQRLVNKLDIAKGILDDYPTCPEADGFNLVPDLRSCYKLYPSSVLVNWTEGEAQCQAASPLAHLVAIDTAEEQAYLRALWDNDRGVSTISRYWTSGHRQENEEWAWILFDAPIKYEYWIATTEHNDPRFECLAVYANEAYHWLDVACWAFHAVTCEITEAGARPPNSPREEEGVTGGREESGARPSGDADDAATNSRANGQDGRPAPKTRPNQQPEPDVEGTTTEAPRRGAAKLKRARANRRRQQQEAKY